MIHSLDENCFTGLRPPKPPIQLKPLGKTNAQRCAEYKERLKQDPDKYSDYLGKQKLLMQSWLARRTGDKKAADHVAARIRKQLSRLVT